MFTSQLEVIRSYKHILTKFVYFHKNHLFPHNAPKTRHSYSNTSKNHVHISHIIIEIHTYLNHSLIPINSKNSRSSSHFFLCKKKVIFKVKQSLSSCTPFKIILNSLLQKSNHNAIILFVKDKFWKKNSFLNIFK